MILSERKRYTDIGYHFAEGVFRSVGAFCLGLLAWAFLVHEAHNRFGWGADNSDPPHGYSGMAVLTDHLTGCQYLNAASLTPRLDVAGRQVCKP